MCWQACGHPLHTCCCSWAGRQETCVEMWVYPVLQYRFPLCSTPCITVHAHSPRILCHGPVRALDKPPTSCGTGSSVAGGISEELRWEVLHGLGSWSGLRVSMSTSLLLQHPQPHMRTRSSGSSSEGRNWVPAKSKALGMVGSGSEDAEPFLFQPK